jgi:peptidoglycan/LPS O-acetylase OafA/YrhL
MRAVAVGLVLLNHAGVPGFRGGYVGVDVFFVLSGFLITGLILGEACETGRVSLRRFYMRRARRILPAAMLTLVATDLAAYSLTNVVRAKQAIDDSVWTAFFAANIHFAHIATNYFDRGQAASPLLHYWSLAVEEQFYLVWPVLVGAVFLVSRRRGARGAGLLASTLGALSLAWSVHDTNANPAAAYFSTFDRAWELALGAVLAFGVVRIAMFPGWLRAAAGWSGLAAILVAAVVYGTGTAFPGSAALLPCLGAAAVIAAGVGEQSRAACGRLLALPPFTWLGDRSYALYLWHWPILVIATDYADRNLTLGVKLMLLVLAIALSAVSYALIENPIRRHRWSGRVSLVMWPATVGVSLAIAVLMLHLVNAKIPTASAAPLTTASGPVDPALPAVKTAANQAEKGASIPASLIPSPAQLGNDHYQPDSGCAGSNGQTTTKTCFVGDTSHCGTVTGTTTTGGNTTTGTGGTVTSCPPAAGRRLIVILGDSHAEMWMPALLDIATGDGWTLLMLDKSGCTPDTWTSKELGPRSGTPSWSECHTWYRWALGTAKALKPTAVIAAGAYTRGPGSNQYVAGMAAAAKDAKGIAKAVVVMGDTPRMAKDPTDCLLHQGNTLKSCATNYPVSLWATDDLIAAKAKAVHAGFLSTRGWFCFLNICPMVVGHTIVYRDTGHVTTEYARRLDQPFRTAVEQMILNQLTG